MDKICVRGEKKPDPGNLKNIFVYSIDPFQITRSKVKGLNMRLIGFLHSNAFAWHSMAYNDSVINTMNEFHS